MNRQGKQTCRRGKEAESASLTPMSRSRVWAVMASCAKRDDRNADQPKKGASSRRSAERCHRCGEAPTALKRDPITQLRYCKGCLYFIELARGLKVIFGKNPSA